MKQRISIRPAILGRLYSLEMYDQQPGLLRPGRPIRSNQSLLPEPIRCGGRVGSMRLRCYSQQNSPLGGYQWFNPASYAQPTPHTFGSCGLGTVRGHGLATLDFNLSKTFTFTEGQALDPRAEFMNLTNNPDPESAQQLPRHDPRAPAILAGRAQCPVRVELPLLKHLTSIPFAARPLFGAASQLFFPPPCGEEPPPA